MNVFESKVNCCGCTGCINACPNSAIKMQPDFEGFLYPEIDELKCINCGICRKVCPIINFSEPVGEQPKTYVLRSSNQDVLRNSTSGGFTTSIIYDFVKNGGIVCAASYGKDNEVEHIIIDSENVGNSISKIRGSKYVQSDLNRVFSEIKKYLMSGKKVCFIGTTCQTTGLFYFLRNKYENLYLVDLVCHGTPSPMLWKRYIEYQETKHKSKVSSAIFRNKTYGYHSGTMKLQFENGKEYYGSARVDFMLKSFFSEISSRPSCYECKFKTLNRVSDFTIFDAWHASKLVEGLQDDDCGFTNVIVHTEKADKLLCKLKSEYVIYEVDTEKAISLDGIMVRQSAKPHKLRDKFYQNINEHGIEKTIQLLIPVTKKDCILEKSKAILYKMGVLSVLKRVIKDKE